MGTTWLWAPSLNKDAMKSSEEPPKTSSLNTIEKITNSKITVEYMKIALILH